VSGHHHGPDLAVLVPLATAAGIYTVGVAKLWHSAGWGRGVTLLNVASFALCWICLVLAIASPLDALAHHSFTMHMIEHELLMAAAPPLFVASRPLTAFGWALPSLAERLLASSSAYATALKALATPFVATTLHALAIWIWHVPALFDAALGNDAVHLLQHLSFFFTGMIFWWSLARLSSAAQGIAVACLFFTAMHTGFLGAFLAISKYPWYGGDASVFGLTALEDQQLGGVVMWVPASVVYVASALVAAARWLDRPHKEMLGTKPGLDFPRDLRRTTEPTRPVTKVARTRL
jgi:cytochrome c oxidase assembly factor CtaG